ncbi:cyclic nucleotide-binding domain-containing protein [Tardiphaga alba]|uniref:Cyclic nucleotide-binding domain-containing protein n=1 Tax=Tardiphaga alba TaxID=340268 RepID=A0ABX8ADC9_9BRAD|nr:patatin-like phospholipase family protein [Tardiphaga alba]QUS40976.1 cyclic nucleotide-binding domain-containing protein [Tardiphaga alba]
MRAAPDFADQPSRQLLQTILGNHFATDDAGILAAIEAGTHYIDLSSGETLFRQGDPGDDVYFVLSGRLRAIVMNGNDRKVLGEIRRGETIGELALFTGEPRSASIIAMRDSSVAKVSRSVVEAAISKVPQIALSMTRLVIERFRRAERAGTPPAVPVNVCVLPISAGVDAARFAAALRTAQPDPTKIAIITPADIAAQLGNQTGADVWKRYGAVDRHVNGVEADNGALYLVAEHTDTEWTRFCLRHADEVLLLADAAATPDLSAVERDCLHGTTPISIANRTLVLQHDAATKSPSGTARWLAQRPATRHFHIRPALDADMRRIARIISGRAIGLVLAGGGAKGFAHVGVVKAIEEAGIEADFIGGTSIGAIMGMVMALGLDASGVRTAVHKAFVAHPKGNITGDYNFLPLVSLIRGRRSHDAISAAVFDAAASHIDMEDTWKTFFVIASNYSTGGEAVLTHGSLARNVIASYAIPGALPPVFIDGHMMFDGGTFNNFPVDVMAELGVGKIIGIDLSTDHGRTFELASVPGTMALLRDKFRPRKKRRYRLPSVFETMLASSFITSASKQKSMRKHVHLLFQPQIPRTGLLEWKRFDQIVEASYVHARDMLVAMDEDAKRVFR